MKNFKNLLRAIVFLCWIFAWASPSLPQSNIFETHKVLSKTSDGITLRVVYNFPDKNIRSDYLKEFIRHHLLMFGNELSIFPASSFSLVSFSKKPQAVLLHSHRQDISIFGSLKSPEEISIGDSSIREKPAPWISLSQEQNVPILKVQKLGTFREFPLWSLQVFPFHLSADQKTVTFFDTLVIRIDWGSSGLQKRTRSVPESASILQQVKGMVLNPSTVKNVAVATSNLHLGKPGFISPSERKVTGFRLLVAKEGWYRITYGFLKEQKIPLEKVNWANLSLKLKDKAIPFVSHGLDDGRFDPGDSFEFWGHPNYNTLYPDADDMVYDPYALESAYFVVWGDSPGNNYGVENGGFFSAETMRVYKPHNFMATVHAEKDKMYSRLSRVTPGVNRDHWFWGSIGAGEIQDYPIDLPTPDIYSNRLVKVRIMLHGMTYGHHKVRAFLSNHRILQGDWYDQTKYSLETDPAAGVFGGQLDEEKNALTIINDSDDELDFFLVNWFDVTYPRLYKAEKNFIKFTRPVGWPAGRYQFAIDGFSSPNIEVFKIGQSQIFGGQVEEIVDSLKQKSYRLIFEDDVPSAQTSYIALTPDAKLTPESVHLVYESNLKNPANQADYLIIMNPYFAGNEALRRLIDLRASQGLSVEIALTDEIYDQFSDGEKSPVGIKNFLTYVYNTWQKPAPTYVLLVGDGNYAVRNLSAQSVNFVPVYHYQTIKFGASVSDMWYTLVSGNDLVPDYFIGRLPARTNEELNHMLEKILSYETHPANGDWRNRMLMIAGRDKFFHEQNAKLARDYLPKSFLVQKFTAFPPSDPFYGDTQKLLSYFDQGVSYANFMGHGGGAVWADNLLLRFDDIRLLKNAPNYPVITSMTCFTAAFDSPSDVSCLGEQLLKLNHRGAVAFLGASGVGWVWNDYYLLKQLIHHLFVNPAPSIGAAVALGKIDYQAKYFTPQRESMVYQYNLLGDPALRPVFPKDSLIVATDQKIYSGGDTVRAKISALVQTGYLSLTLVDSIGFVKKTGEVSFSASTKPVEMILPQDLEPGLYWLTFDLSAGESFVNYHGALPVAVGRTSIISVRSVPATVVVGDSVTIQARIAGISHDAKVYCAFESPAADSLKMQFRSDINRFETPRPVVFQKVESVMYHISILENGRTLRSPERTFRVNNVGDFRFRHNSLQVAVNDSIFLQAAVQNNSAVSYTGVPVEFWQIQSGDSLLLGKCRVNFNPYEERRVQVAVVLPSGTVVVKASVNSDGSIRERDLTNNFTESIIETPAFYFSPKEGFRVSATRVDSVCTWRNVYLAISKNSCAVPFVLSFGNSNWSDFRTDQAIEIVKPSGWRAPVLNLNSNVAEMITASLRLSLSDSLTNRVGREIDLFQFYPKQKIWAKVLQTSLKDTVFQAKIRGLGAFAFFKKNESVSPRVTISANKRAFYDGGYLGNHPKFTISMQDEDGIHPDGTAQEILLDGQPLDKESSDYQANFGDNSLVLTFSPELSAGKHELTVRGMDCMGNRSKAISLHFRVASNFDLKILGNYPNPFRDQTVFAYELTAPAADISLKIYTVSGRLVRRFRLLDFVDDPDPLESGYHEQTWDGTDKNGEEVANGVYYFKFSAKGEKKTIEKTGKIVRIK